MSELINLFSKLSDFFDRNILWEQVEELYEKESENRIKPKSANSKSKKPRKNKSEDTSSEDSDDEPLSNKANTTKNGITSLPVVECALQNSHVLSTLLELCTTIRHLRGEASASYDNTYDCWDQVVKSAPRDAYLSFIYTLAGLTTLDATSSTYTKLSLAAVNTYFLSLTIPGAKGFHIFDEDVISHCLQVFTLVERIQNPEMSRSISRQQQVEIWVRLVALCDDVKLLLRYVHLNDHKTTREAILKKLINIIHLNHERGYANHYAANLHSKCFEIFEEMSNAHNGEPEETLMKLLNMTVFLHTYPPKPKNAPGAASYSSDGTRCEHISDWFISCIAKYPRLLVKLLNFYIECIVTNPIKTWKTEQLQRALEYAARYDAALFTKCNASCVEFLCEAVYADEVLIRSRAIELMARILQLESQVDWQMFRHEVSNIPREVHLIKELIDSLQDSNNNIRLKATQALHNALTKGSPNAQKILSECLRFARFSDVEVSLPSEPRVSKNEIRFEKPTAPEPQYSFEGHGLVSLSFIHLPEYIYQHLYQCPLSHIRRAGIMLMEQLVKLNPLIIFNTNFVAETTNLIHEPTALVRKQTLTSIDATLASYPNCYPLIWVWCKIIVPMLHDGDVKNTELAMECFRSRVLLNMKGIDQSNQAEHFMPWVILRTMLSTQSRLYLQTCFHLALQRRMITPSILAIIESHLLTSNSTEAWIVLNFVCGKVKSKEPDALIHMFTSMESWNKEQNMLIALEVLATCIKDFSHSALNHAFTHILSSIKEGQVLPVLIGKAFDFLLLIDNCSQAQKSVKNKMKDDNADNDWIHELHDFLEERLIGGINDFPDNRATFMSYLYSYSEVNLQTRLRPQRTIISFVHMYINECIKLSENELHLDNERLFNSMILIAGRFSLRDACVATTTCMLYSGVLKNIDRPPIVNTIIVALTDLCKKHTQIVENIICDVLRKLSSPYAVNRIETFKCFEKLVLQDQLKLRGSLLLALLAGILDEYEELAKRANDFFTEYLSKKNPALFQKCLIECPFVLNEYKNFEGLDSFSDTNIKSRFKGEPKRKKRQTLYNHFMEKIDDVNLVLYFGQMKLIADKAQHDPLMKSPDGIALIKDVLFILRRICELVKEQKNTNEKTDGDQKDDDMTAEMAEISAEMNENATTTANAATNNVSASAPSGRGRRKREITMPDALVLLEKSLIFIPNIYEAVKESDASIEKHFDELGKALWIRFPQLIEYAQPAAFWIKYKPAAGSEETNKKAGKRPVPVTSPEESESDRNSDEDSDFDSYRDLVDGVESPESSVSFAKQLRIDCAQLHMEYLFNPNI